MIVGLIIAAVLTFLAFRLIAGVVKFGVIALIVIVAAYVFMHGGLG